MIIYVKATRGRRRRKKRVQLRGELKRKVNKIKGKMRLQEKRTNVREKKIPDSKEGNEEREKNKWL